MNRLKQIILIKIRIIYRKTLHALLKKQCSYLFIYLGFADFLV
ncbi:hypothetical protein ES705_20019 [subsurface metagenome]